MDTFDLISLRGKISGVTYGCHIGTWSIKSSETTEFVELLYQGSTQNRTGIPLLFPQFGFAEGMKKHGFARDLEWHIIEKSSNSVSLRLTQEDISQDDQDQYPYKFSTVVNIILEENGDLLYTLRVLNTDQRSLPIAPGLHPYWSVPQNIKKLVSIDGISGFEANNIDWDSAPPDTPFPYTKKITIKMPDRAISIEDCTPGNQVVSDIVIWSQPVSSSDYNYICVEPVCGYNNALTTHPILVKPETEWIMKLRFTASLLQR